MINNPPADVMAEYLVAQGLFTDPSKGKAWPIYLTHEPDAPTTKDDVGTIYDTIGVKDGRVMSGENIFHFGIKSVCEHSSISTAGKKHETSLLTWRP